MAIQRKLNSGINMLKPTLSSSDGATKREEIWQGPYDLLAAKQLAVYRQAKSSMLTQDGPNGRLVLTYETPASGDYQFPGGETITEVFWAELRKPVETHSAFATLTAASVLQIKKNVEQASGTGTPAPPSSDPTETKLWNLLAKGTTEYSVGVPVVRRTKTKMAGNQGGGSAWKRESPPVSVPGKWEFMKTADERRRDGKTYTQIEEWTGAETWDETLYS